MEKGTIFKEEVDVDAQRKPKFFAFLLTMMLRVLTSTMILRRSDTKYSVNVKVPSTEPRVETTLWITAN